MTPQGPSREVGSNLPRHPLGTRETAGPDTECHTAGLEVCGSLHEVYTARVQSTPGGWRAREVPPRQPLFPSHSPDTSPEPYPSSHWSAPRKGNSGRTEGDGDCLRLVFDGEPCSDLVVCDGDPPALDSVPDEGDGVGMVRVPQDRRVRDSVPSLGSSLLRLLSLSQQGRRRHGIPQPDPSGSGLFTVTRPGVGVP